MSSLAQSKKGWVLASNLWHVQLLEHAAIWFRFRVLHMSDAPVLTPLTKLSEFVAKVGEAPSQDSLQIYLQRLREHGFDVSPTLRKTLQCGLKIQREVGFHVGARNWASLQHQFRVMEDRRTRGLERALCYTHTIQI